MGAVKRAALLFRCAGSRRRSSATRHPDRGPVAQRALIDPDALLPYLGPKTRSCSLEAFRSSSMCAASPFECGAYERNNPVLAWLLIHAAMSLWIVALQLFGKPMWNARTPHLDEFGRFERPVTRPETPLELPATARIVVA